MNNFLNKSMWALFALAMVITSCSKEDLIEQTTESHNEDIAIGTEVVVDGEDVTNTRAASAAGWTTGDGRYHQKAPVTVAAYANEGYELVRFYDKGGNPDQQNSSSYTFAATINQTFKAEFKTVSKYTITATAETGGTVSGGGTFKQGTNCTLTANSNSGYTFDGWYENGSKVSSSSTYTFTVSSNRTLTAKFAIQSTDATVSAYWSGSGYTDVNVSFKLKGPNGDYKFVLPTHGGAISKKVAPGTYKVMMVLASGRPSINASIGIIEAIPSDDEITVAAGDQKSISIQLLPYRL